MVKKIKTHILGNIDDNIINKRIKIEVKIPKYNKNGKKMNTSKPFKNAVFKDRTFQTDIWEIDKKNILEVLKLDPIEKKKYHNIHNPKNYVRISEVICDPSEENIELPLITQFDEYFDGKLHKYSNSRMVNGKPTTIDDLVHNWIVSEFNDSEQYEIMKNEIVSDLKSVCTTKPKFIVKKTPQIIQKIIPSLSSVLCDIQNEVLKYQKDDNYITIKDARLIAENKYHITKPIFDQELKQLIIDNYYDFDLGQGISSDLTLNDALHIDIGGTDGYYYYMKKRCKK
ncbi:MAG: hypothetical protein WC934_06185 [Acidithiobacillus sp.]|jgi:hypothetical protein|uniref:hypothetical protein n=1 Tax=Acidithiobacillus sp. TaxID=1872118 RepID=UPI00355D1BEA